MTSFKPVDLTIDNKDSLQGLLEFGIDGGTRYQFNPLAGRPDNFNIAIMPPDGSINHQPVQMNDEMKAYLKKFRAKYPGVVTMSEEAISGKIPTDFDEYQKVMHALEPMLGLRKPEVTLASTRGPRLNPRSDEYKQIEHLRSLIIQDLLDGNKDLYAVIDREVGNNDGKLDDVDLNKLQIADAGQLYEVAKVLAARIAGEPKPVKAVSAPMLTPAAPPENNVAGLH